MDSPNRYAKNPDIPRIIEAVMIAIDGEDPVDIQVALGCVMNSVQTAQVQSAVQRGPREGPY